MSARRGVSRGFILVGGGVISASLQIKPAKRLSLGKSLKLDVFLCAVVCEVLAADKPHCFSNTQPALPGDV